MKHLTEAEAVSILAMFAAGMLLLVWKNDSKSESTDSFLLADRNVSLFRGALSIAVSWIWAPAIFICSMQAYLHGVAGIFWFTAPNVLCFFLFAPLALRLRESMPSGYTLPEFIFLRFQGNRAVHLAFLFVFLAYQLGAIVINALAGGALLHAISGLRIELAILATSGIALTYSLRSGLRASVLTDVIQMLLVLVISLVLVPWCLFESGGFDVIHHGLGGVTGEFASVFHPGLAFTLGIPMTLSLLAGPIGDQMFFQRALAVRQESVVKTFVLGGLLFAIVPISLSLLGFLGAGLAAEGLIEVQDPQLIGPIVLSYLLPKAALYAFCFMAFAGLCSTMDSAFCAVSSLGGIDLYRRYFKPDASDSAVIYFSRLAMCALAALGTAIALLQPKLLWVFLVYGAVASAAMFPTILSLYWQNLSAKGAFYGLLLSLLITIPLSIYANVNEVQNLIVVSSVLSVGLGLAVCLLVDGLLKQTDDIEMSAMVQ